MMCLISGHCQRQRRTVHSPHLPLEVEARKPKISTKMLTKPWATWPLLLQFILVSIVIADVSHLAKDYLPPDVGQPVSQAQADEPTSIDHMQANDGTFFPMAGLMLPPGYAIPTDGNVAPPMSPPNFPLPIYPPFFGFGGSPEGLAGGPVPPGFPNEGQFPGGSFPVASQGGQFPIGPQGGPFPVNSQPGQFSAALQSGSFPLGPQSGPFPSGPQGGSFPGGLQGAPFGAGPQGGPFPTGSQSGSFPGGPQGGPFPAGPQGVPFPVGPIPQNPQGGPFPYPPDYLTTQGLPSAGMQLPFGMPPGFGGPVPTYPYQQLANVGQPFSPSFGIPGQHYQPQPFADEPEPEVSAKPKNGPTTSTTIAPKSSNRETIYASNGGYVYQRAK